MEAKLRVAILFGGKSAEHEVSLQSAKNIIEAIDRQKFEPVLIGIDKQGLWHLNDAENYLLDSDNPKLIALDRSGAEVHVTPGAAKNQVLTASSREQIGHLDVVFPVLHGPYGEDGSVQGLLKVANVAFVGSSVLGSAVGMDKDVMKRLLRDAGIPVPNFLVFSRNGVGTMEFAPIERQLGSPMFVKPANLGSSVGISMVRNERSFLDAIHVAFEYDRKIVVEECITGREIECSLLGNERPEASLPGEVVTNKADHEFYSYDAKYIDESGATLEIPANLPESKVKEIQGLAIKAFKVLCCEGMARADLFLKPDGTILVNELNTIPGFTAISMYPKLWEASGKPYTQLITELIELAIQRSKEERALRTSV